jgi:hypothetical protein
MMLVIQNGFASFFSSLSRHYTSSAHHAVCSYSTVISDVLAMRWSKGIG